MKIRKQQTISPVVVAPGDTLSLIYHERGRPDRVVLSEKITETHHFDEAVILESEPDEFGADFGLGGLFLEHHEKQ